MSDANDQIQEEHYQEQLTAWRRQEQAADETYNQQPNKKGVTNGTNKIR